MILGFIMSSTSFSKSSTSSFIVYLVILFVSTFSLKSDVILFVSLMWSIEIELGADIMEELKGFTPEQIKTLIAMVNKS